MRRIVSALVTVSTCLAGCGGSEPAAAPAPKAPTPVAATSTAEPARPAAPPPAPKPSLADMQKQALTTALTSLNAHDAKGFASVYADDAVISVAGLNDVEGRDAIAANMSEWFDTFKNVKLGFSRVWVKDDTMVLEWVINGTHHGELFGVKGKEEPVGHYGLSVVTFDHDGKVVRENRYGELGTVMAQVAGKGQKPRAIPTVPEKPEIFTPQPLHEGDAPPFATASGLFHALEKKEQMSFLSTLSDDVQSDGLFQLETVKGKEGAKAFYKSFAAAFPDAKFELARKPIEVGHYVIVESVLKGTQKGPLGSIKATGRPIAIHLADVVHVKDHAVDRISTYQNSLELQQQLGLFDVASAGTVPASQAAPKSPASPKPASTK